MAINPSSAYSGQVTTGDGGYPYGKAKNITVAGDGTGTPLEAGWVNDWFGFVQAMLDRAATAPSGTPEQVGASQLLDALDARFGTQRNLVVELADMMSGAWTPHRYASAALSDVRDCVVCNNGQSMFAVNGNTEQILSYVLNTPYDQSSAVLLYSYTLTNFGGSAVEGITINPDGDKILVCGREATPLDALVQQYNLSTPWDLTTVADGTEWLPSGMYQSDILNAVRWSGDGTKLFIIGRATGNVTTEIQAYYTSTPYSLAGMGTEISQLDVTDPGGGVEARSFEISDDGRRLFVVDGVGEMFEYRLISANDLAGAQGMSRTRSLSPVDTFRNISFAVGDEARAYMVAGARITSMYSSVVAVT